MGKKLLDISTWGDEIIKLGTEYWEYFIWGGVALTFFIIYLFLK